MKALKFNLSGKTAFFKKGDVNQPYLFTYSNIHKITILGILGSILGLTGYSKQKQDKTMYPEFYEKLKHLKISIVPKSQNNGYFIKKIQQYNNTTGLASKEDGGNLIMQEQWLYNVEWDIFILDDSSEVFSQISYNLKNNICEYIPYLGRNDHYANIKCVEDVELDKIENPEYFTSLFLNNNKIKLDYITVNNDEAFRYAEYLPTALDQNGMYVTELFTLTNKFVNCDGLLDSVYSYEKDTLMFY